MLNNDTADNIFHFKTCPFTYNKEKVKVKKKTCQPQQDKTWVYTKSETMTAGQQIDQAARMFLAKTQTQLQRIHLTAMSRFFLFLEF